MINKKNSSWMLLLALILLTQACAPAQATRAPSAEKPKSATPTSTPAQSSATGAAISTATPFLTFTPTLTPASTPVATRRVSTVTISALKGNLFIRRGPDMAYNPVGVLYKGTTANVIAHDVLYKWAQIEIPNSAETGWVSVLTQYSKFEGDLKSLPQFTVTDWPLPAYLRNCTHHQMFIEPGKIFLDSSYVLENEVWLYPGHYTIYDISLADPLAFLEVDMSEGNTIEITEDGAGERRKCED